MTRDRRPMRPGPAPARRRGRGTTLVDVLAACAVAGVLAAVALPSWQRHLVQARRHDAVHALTRLQAAQERFRAAHGLYSADFSALQTAPTSAQGLYALALELTGPDRYRASARVLARDDADCPQLLLEVDSGFATSGPDRRCWNR